MTHKIIYIALAGGVGALARYGLSGLVQRLAGSAFPWGTFAVNATGCLLFGLAWALTVERFPGSGELRIVLLVGFLGAFTTFSTFMAESGQLLAAGQYWHLMGNIILQNVAGLALFFLGLALGRLI